MSTHSLKELHTRRSKLQAELKRREQEAIDAKELVERTKSKLNEVGSAIRIRTTDPQVTEHAVLRYLEHTTQLDVEAIKAEILNAELSDRIKKLGSGKFPIGGGLRAVVKKNEIVTVING